MRALYHLTMPASPMADCEAVAQDVRLLQRIAPGKQVHLYPVRKPGTRIPRALWGLHQLPTLWRAERLADFHHIFNPDPFPFPSLRLLKRPVIYTVVGSVCDTHQRMALQLSRFVKAIIVFSEADRARLESWGIAQTRCIHPAIDAGKFSYTPPPEHAPFTLLAGSAPWTREQFKTKGVDTLLEAVQRRRDLRIIFLWRGILLEEMMRRVNSLGVADRVHVLNERVDVNRILALANASIVLAARSDLVKAYPHSLLESLAAGKPVLVSRTVPMASWVEQMGLGVVIHQMNVADLLAGLDELQARYSLFSPQKLQASVAGQTDRFLQQHKQIYEQCIADR